MLVFVSMRSLTLGLSSFTEALRLTRERCNFGECHIQGTDYGIDGESRLCLPLFDLTHYTSIERGDRPSPLQLCVVCYPNRPIPLTRFIVGKDFRRPLEYTHTHESFSPGMPDSPPSDKSHSQKRSDYFGNKPCRIEIPLMEVNLAESHLLGGLNVSARAQNATSIIQISGKLFRR